MSDTPIIQFIGTDFLRSPACEMHAHEVYAHEAYAPETDEHCAVFTIRHPLSHRSTLSPTYYLTGTCCLPREPATYHEYLLLIAYYEYLAASREHAAYTHLLDFATCSKIYLSQGYFREWVQGPLIRSWRWSLA
jgi:hypothetical protein